MKATEQSDNDLVSRNILIARYHKDFLDAHPEINLSGFVRMKLDEAMKEGK